MKKAMRVLAAVVLAAGAGLVPAAGAQAAGDCWSGYACGYEHLDYTGAVYGTALTTQRWSSGDFANVATGASANGASCKATRFYRSYDYTKLQPYGDYFTLQSQQRVGSNWKDPDLRNGAGGSSGDWNDDIEATRFVLC